MYGRPVSEERFPVHLAATGLWQFLAKQHMVRLLELREVPTAMRDDVRCRDIGVSRRLNVHDDLFALDVVRYAHRCDVGNAGHPEHDIVDL